MTRMALPTTGYNLDQESRLLPPTAVWMLPIDKDNLGHEEGRKTRVLRRSTDAGALPALRVGLDLSQQALNREH